MNNHTIDSLPDEKGGVIQVTKDDFIFKLREVEKSFQLEKWSLDNKK